MYKSDDSGPIPDRWLNCPRNSNSFITDKFLAFKTPLNVKFNSKLPIECRFPPSMVFSYMKMSGSKLGLWMDLTNTNRFYDRTEVEQNKCVYQKLQCRGHGETPSPSQTQSFIQLVDEFIQTNPFDIIGVHCTHGFNRTGFLIVAYMVEKMDCSVEAALRAFASARPPGIYKNDYIRELFRRYDDEDDAIPAPELPNWCFEFNDEDDTDNSVANDNSKPNNDEHDNADYNYNDVDDDDDDDNDEDDDENNVIDLKRKTPKAAVNGDNGGGGRRNSSIGGHASGSGSKSNDSTAAGGGSGGTTSAPPNKRRRRNEFINRNATFMSGVPGVTLVSEPTRLAHLQTTVQNMCNWNGKTGFPGCQPVSMTQENLKCLHNKPYRVSWKADGTRYMMLIYKKGEIYFFDRDNSCFQVSGIYFPHIEEFKRHLSNTLVDGEMVIDKVNGENIPRYLIYDIIYYENEDVSKLSFFPNRLRYIEVNIIGPRIKAFTKGFLNRAREPFGIRHKQFFELSQAHSLLGPKFAKLLSHEPDGLIFQPSIDPYMPGPCEYVLKWKPLDMNSIDFRLEIVTEEGTGILKRKIANLYVGRHDAPVAQIKYTKELKDLNNKIIECKYANNEWVFMRERTDKSFPNSADTAKAVFNSIKNPVTNDILLRFIDHHKFLDDSDIMPPPPPTMKVHHNYVPPPPQQSHSHSQQQEDHTY